MDSDETNRPPLPLLFQLISPNNYSFSSVAAPKMSAAMISDSSSSFVHSECVELRSRNTKTHGGIGSAESCRHENFTTHGVNGNKLPLMEHVVKNGESLMQISLQYSVPVSEIKRVNNIVADHEIHGLPLLRIPVTRAFLLRRQMNEAEEEKGQREGKIIDILGEEATSTSNCDEPFDASTDQRVAHRNTAKEFEYYRGQFNNRQNISRRTDFGTNELLRGSDESLTGHAKEVIEGILDETDRNMATVRQNLPSPTVEGGAFHFVDAGAPDNSSSVWIIVAVVLIVFVLLPLSLTFLEERSETEDRHQQRPTQ